MAWSDLVGPARAEAFPASPRMILHPVKVNLGWALPA